MKHWLRTGRDYVRELVRKRDGYRCTKCKRKWPEGTRRFDVHHRNGLCGHMSRAYDHVKDMKGLVTLCHRCHINLHSVQKHKKAQYGKLTKNPQKMAEARRLLKEGLSYDAIADRVGVKGASVYYALNGRKG